MRACSTPFGIIGILTPATEIYQVSPLRCSTPFGIIGILTLSTKPHERSDLSAQRLSASSEFSLIFSFSYLKSAILCSTPFGIIGILTAYARKKGSTLTSGAQRLSASSEFSPNADTSIDLGTSRAQRLSASSEFSLRGCQPNCFPHVTNCVFTHR